MKYNGVISQASAKESAPTRGPWIEILLCAHSGHNVLVGPHTGAVD